MTLEVLTGELVDTDVSGWADRIRPHLAAVAGSMIAACSEVHAAKEALGDSKLDELAGLLGVSKGTVSKWATIGGNAAIVSHGKRMPLSWTTVYELAQVPADKLDEAIEDGRITADLDRETARSVASQLISRRPPEPKLFDTPKGKPVPGSFEAAAVKAERSTGSPTGEAGEAGDAPPPSDVPAGVDESASVQGSNSEAPDPGQPSGAVEVAEGHDSTALDDDEDGQYMADVAAFFKVPAEEGWDPSITHPEGRGYGPSDRFTPSERCSPTILSRFLRDAPTGEHLFYRGACLGCGFMGDVLPMRGRGENGATEDAHDHVWPGWRDLPVVPRPEGIYGDSKAVIKKREKWIAACLDAGMTMEWLEAGGPILTARGPMATRHNWPGTPWGGYDMSAVLDEDTDDVPPAGVTAGPTDTGGGRDALTETVADADAHAAGDDDPSSPAALGTEAHRTLADAAWCDEFMQRDDVDVQIIEYVESDDGDPSECRARAEVMVEAARARDTSELEGVSVLAGSLFDQLYYGRIDPEMALELLAHALSPVDVETTSPAPSASTGYTDTKPNLDNYKRAPKRKTGPDVNACRAVASKLVELTGMASDEGLAKMLEAYAAVSPLSAQKDLRYRAQLVVDELKMFLLLSDVTGVRDE